MTCLGLGLLFLVSASQLSAESPILVTTVSLQDQVVYPQRQASASVISLGNTHLSAQISAVVESIPVRVGDQVETGDTLVVLDCKDYEIAQRQAAAAVAAAKAQLRLANQQLERAKRLVTEKLVSQDDVDVRAANKDARKADLLARQAEQDRAQLDVSRCNISAPFAGVVRERLVAEGQLASPGTVVATMVDPQRLEVTASVGLEDAALLSKVTNFMFDDGRIWPVSLRRQVAFVNPETRNQDVRFVFTQADTPLPGTSGRLVWNAPQPYLSSRFIVERDGRLGFFTLKDSQAVFNPLPQAKSGRDAPINADLSSRLITAPLAQLKAGMQVSPRP